LASLIYPGNLKASISELYSCNCLSLSQLSIFEAREIGLINFISTKELIDEEVLKFAENLVAKTSANSLALTKNLICEIQHQNLEDALIYAAELNAKARNSKDCKKGISAFLNKERIVW